MKFLVLIVIMFLSLGLKVSNIEFFKSSSVPPPPYIDLKKMESPSLEKIVKKGLEETTGDYAFYIKNLNKGEEYSLNKDKQYESGSLYKLWVMAVVFEKIKNGELKEDDVLSDSVESLNKKFDLEEGFLEMPEDAQLSILVKDAVFQMITISHNYSALLLLDKAGAESVSKFLSKEGLLNSTIMNKPATTAYDLALFFEKLYKGEIIDREYSDKMIDILKQQTLNGGIPNYLPDEVKVAHKTGDLGWNKHDGGIVYSPHGDFIIVALSESDNPAGALERIALVSKAVYDFFTAN